MPKVDKNKSEKKEAFEFLTDKYDKLMDEEHLLLKHQVTPNEARDIENNYSGEFIKHMKKQQGNDFAIKLMKNMGMESNNAKRNGASKNANSRRVKGDDYARMIGGSVAEYKKSIIGRFLLNMHAADERVRAMTLFNMSYNVIMSSILSWYGTTSTEFSVLHAPYSLFKYIDLLYYLHGKFDDHTMDILKSIINTYIDFRIKEIDSTLVIEPNADVFTRYYNYIVSLGLGSYGAINKENLDIISAHDIDVGIANIYNEHGKVLFNTVSGMKKYAPADVIAEGLTEQTGICDREKRISLWKAIVASKSYDFDAAGYTIKELEDILGNIKTE